MGTILNRTEPHFKPDPVEPETNLGQRLEDILKAICNTESDLVRQMAWELLQKYVDQIVRLVNVDADGPTAAGFRWKNIPHELVGKNLEVLQFVWPQPGRACSMESLAQAVWQCSFEMCEGGMQAVRRNLNWFFTNHGIRLYAKMGRGYFRIRSKRPMLKKPKRGPKPTL